MGLRPFSAALLMVMLGLTGCSPKPAANPPEEPQGSLVVSAGDAAIFTISPQGTARFDLVEEQSGRVVIQPTWSPDGDRIVWTEVDHMSERPEVSIVISGPGGEELRRVDASVAPFYYHWDPSGRTVAFLASGPGGTVELGVVDQELSMLSDAQPFYLAWSPDGQTLLTHTDLERVALLPIDGGAPTVLEETPARFQAPQWSDAGDHLIYAIGSPPSTGGIRAGTMQTDSNSQEIVVATPQGEIVQRITTVTGVATFELSPDGTRLAYSDTLDRAAFNFGPLIVTDLTSGDSTTVSRDPVLAFQWSPTGESLLYLGSEEGVDHPNFRWAVWDGTTSTEYGRVTPTVVFATDYLPFWDQYSRSHSLWSPDGSAFVYSGTDAQGDPAVWVQKVGDGSEPRRVATGDVAFWSPK